MIAWIQIIKIEVRDEPDQVENGAMIMIPILYLAILSIPLPRIPDNLS
jgi:hypothetical protein